MTRDVRIRLIAFVVLSAIGITYVTATYLGLVDRVTGRDLTVTVTLPGSGGLFEGSEVTYRGREDRQGHRDGDRPRTASSSS